MYSLLVQGTVKRTETNAQTDKHLFTYHTSTNAMLTSCVGGRHNMPRPCKLTSDLFSLKVVSESRVTWATSVPILVFLGLFVLDLGLMYATDRQTSDVRRA